MNSINEKARRLAKMSADEITAEERKQTGELVDLIYEAIEGHGKTKDLPMLSSVFAALVEVEAVWLATLDRDTRRCMRKSAEAARPKVLAAALAKGLTRTQLVTTARHDA